MLIGIDGNEANIKQRVGVNQYGFELLWNLWKLQDEWKNKHTLVIYLKEDPLRDMPKATQYFKYKIISGKNIWIIKKLMPSLFFDKPKPDIFFSPSHYVPLFSPIPRICSIMDLGYLEFSGQFRFFDFWQLKLWSAISIFVSNSVLAISNNTKKDIVRHYQFASGKVYVTPLASDIHTLSETITQNDVRRVMSKYSIVDDYILYLGTLKPSKNVEGLIRAFSQISDLYPQISLVIAGKKGWLYEPLFKLVDELKLNDKVVFTDYVTDEEKYVLRKEAKVFVQPSFWEGFGIDTLSAMEMGIPVVVSNAGSLPEIVGEGGIVVDPYDNNSIAGGIEKVLMADKLKYNEMVKKGIEQSNKFSWEKTARETLKILENSK